MFGGNYFPRNVKGMYEVPSNENLTLQISELTNQMKSFCSMLSGSMINVSNEVCPICGNYDHAYNFCPKRGQFPEFVKKANMMNSYQPRNYGESCSSSYNSSWENHHNFSLRHQDQYQHQQDSQTMSSFQQREPDLVDTLQRFIQESQRNQQIFEQRRIGFEQRMDQTEAAVSRLEIMVERIAEFIQSPTFSVDSHSESIQDVSIDMGESQSTELHPLEEPIYIPPEPYVPPIPFPGRLMKKKVEKPFFDDSYDDDDLSHANVAVPCVDEENIGCNVHDSILEEKNEDLGIPLTYLDVPPSTKGQFYELIPTNVRVKEKIKWCDVGLKFPIADVIKWPSCRDEITKEAISFYGQKAQHYRQGGFYGPKMCAFLGDPVPP